MKTDKIQYYDQLVLREISEPAQVADDELRIQVVPDHEADAGAGRISEHAPVGRAVLHRREGEIVTIATGRTRYRMQIVSVERHRRAG
jgi:transcription elongation GreA/GreB family factor